MDSGLQITYPWGAIIFFVIIINVHRGAHSCLQRLAIRAVSHAADGLFGIFLHHSIPVPSTRSLVLLNGWMELLILGNFRLRVRRTLVLPSCSIGFSHGKDEDKNDKLMLVPDREEFPMACPEVMAPSASNIRLLYCPVSSVQKD